MKDQITEYLDQIKDMFSFPTTITLIVRSDDMPEGHDLVVTDDDLDQVAGVLLRRGNEELH